MDLKIIKMVNKQINESNYFRYDNIYDMNDEKLQ